MTLTLLYRYDYLKISNEYNHEYGVYCGERTGHTVLVNGKYVVMMFHTDSFLEERGFLLLFIAVPIGNQFFFLFIL